MATADAIRQAIRAQPFVPFSLRLVDGTVYDVKHPDWIHLAPVRRPREVIYYIDANDEGEDYQSRWLDLGLIMEVIIPTSSAAQPAPPA